MLIATLALTLLAAPVHDPVAGRVDPASPEGAAVLAPINATFAALAARDGSLIPPHVNTGGRLTVSVRGLTGARLSNPTWDQFIGGLQPGPERFEEIMVDPLIAIDGDVAMVWGEYIFRIDGQISHCGVDHFMLTRGPDDAWRIENLTWTQRATDCEGIAAKVAAQ